MLSEHSELALHKSPNGSSHDGSYGLRFTVSKATVIHSAVVRPYFTNANVTWKLYNFSTKELVQETLPFAVTSGVEQRVPLNLYCVPGVQYWLSPTADYGSWMRTDQGISFPYVEDVFTFTTGSNLSGSTANRWYYLFDMYYTPSLSVGNVTRAKVSEVGITNGLVAYYPLRTSTKDFSGNGYDGVATGAIPVGGGFDGRGAYSFLPSEDCRIAVEPDILDDAELDSFSVTVWVKPESHNDDWRYIYHRSSGTSGIIGGSISMLAISSANRFSASINGTNYAASSDPVIVGQTYFLSVVYSEGILKLFVNGEEKASRSEDITMDRTGKWAIGSAYYGSLGYRAFLGDISNVKIFNRALTPEEIAVEYKRTGVTKMTQHQGTTYIQGELKEIS